MNAVRNGDGHERKKDAATPVLRKGHSLKRQSVALTVVLLLATILFLFPLAWSLMCSFKTNTEIITNTMALPRSFQFENYTRAWEDGKMIGYYQNTIFVVFLSTTLTLLISSMATYVLARVRPSRFLYFYFVCGLILPVYVVMLPIMKITNFLGITNTLWGLALVYTAVLIAQSFFVLYGYMKMIPHELEEAAEIDGCNYPTIFFRIILPCIKPGLATVCMFALLFGWNDYLLPLVLISGNDQYVLSQAIRAFQQDYSTDYGSMMARIILSILPILILYVLAQQSVVKGVTSGAVKG